jgi:hypothetical protein
VKPAHGRLGSKARGNLMAIGCTDIDKRHTFAARNLARQGYFAAAYGTTAIMKDCQARFRLIRGNHARTHRQSLKAAYYAEIHLNP